MQSCIHDKLSWPCSLVLHQAAIMLAVQVMLLVLQVIAVVTENEGRVLCIITVLPCVTLCYTS